MTFLKFTQSAGGENLLGTDIALDIGKSRPTIAQLLCGHNIAKT